jgi:hypothetical protein
MTTYSNPTVIPPALNLERIPSIYATHPSAKVSERYGFIPTSVIVHALERSGFVPVKAQAARSSRERVAFAKHLIRFRHQEHMNTQVGDWLPEVVLVNSHDGSSSYQIMAGVYRLVCANGMIVGNSFAEARVRHTKNTPDEIVDASFRVIESLPGIADGIEDMRAITLEAGERQAFANAALALRYEEGEAPIRAAQLLEPRRYADTASDLWTTFNTVQEHLLRGGDRTLNATRRTKTRRISSVGKDVALNRALWTLSEEMARLKTGAI